MEVKPDTAWTDDEIVMSDMTPDTEFVFARMTQETLAAADARPGEAILDVACGRAIDAMAMAKKGATLFGIEASDTMIDKALEFMGADRRRVTLARSLAENLPFSDRCFDKVVCKGAMDHFADLDESMAEMTRVTKPDGKVIIAIANFESLTCRLGGWRGPSRRSSRAGARASTRSGSRRWTTTSSSTSRCCAGSWGKGLRSRRSRACPCSGGIRSGARS
jgi:2-polyprenyl-3-methyl-5-hydroxy-6-metoxy-1,4-benzoquinol methylase